MGQASGGTAGHLRSASHEALADFILSFVQALLRTGYYLSDHPEAQKAKVGLYQRFRSLFQGRHELTFMLQDSGGAGGVLVEGALPEPQRLSALMAAGMAEVYATRLAQFLERKQLVSLTLKERMAEAEFSHFVDALSEPAAAVLDGAAKDQFLKHLKDRGISHFSLVFREDLLREDRRLPWRVQLAIARLQKDLHGIPMFQRMDAAGLKKVRQQVLHDVLRPITRADLLAAILVNSDLAESAEVSAQDIEHEIVDFVPAPLLIPTARAALEGHAESADAAGSDRRKRALVRLALRARDSQVPQALGLFRELFDKGFVTLERLPPELRTQIEREQATDRYLAKGAAFRGALEIESEPLAYERKARFVLDLFPELLRRSLLDEVLVLLTLLRGHSALGGPRAEVASRLLDEVTRGPVAGQLKQRFLTGHKEDRVALGPIYRLLGEAMEAQLLEILREAADPWVRKNACEELLHQGPKTKNAILAELARGTFSAKSLAELLMVFGEVGDDSPEIVQTLRAYLRHAEPHVREEAAWSLCRLLGVAEEEAFLLLLEDPDLGVKKRALRCLRTVKSRRAFERVVALLARAEQQPPLRPLAPHLIASLKELAEVSHARGGDAERYLVERLRQGQAHGLRALLQRVQHTVDEEGVLAICDALGFVGTEPSRQMLGELVKSVSAQGRRRVEQALSRVAGRAR